MDAMQNFLNQYTDSKFKDRAAEVITISRQKLEEKGYENARQYLRLRMYKAAVISFDNFKKNFPDSHYLEELAYLKVLSQYRFAEQSFKNLQIDRYTLVVEYHKELVDNFPESKYLKEAEKLYSDSLNKLNQLKSTIKHS